MTFYTCSMQSTVRFCSVAVSSDQSFPPTIFDLAGAVIRLAGAERDADTTAHPMPVGVVTHLRGRRGGPPHTH